MPCLYISTNVNLDGKNIDPIFDEARTAVSTIIGKPDKVCLSFDFECFTNKACGIWFKIV